MKNFLLVAFVLSFCVISSAHAQGFAGSRRLVGTLYKSFDGCGSYGNFPDSINTDLGVSWVVYVSYIIRDKGERISVPATINENVVFSTADSPLYPLNNGGFLKFDYLIRNMFKRSPSVGKPLVTKFVTFFNNAGQFVCQETYRGLMSRRRR